MRLLESVDLLGNRTSAFILLRGDQSEVLGRSLQFRSFAANFNVTSQGTFCLAWWDCESNDAMCRGGSSRRLKHNFQSLLVLIRIPVQHSGSPCCCPLVRAIWFHSQTSLNSSPKQLNEETRSLYLLMDFYCVPK